MVHWIQGAHYYWVRLELIINCEGREQFVLTTFILEDDVPKWTEEYFWEQLKQELSEEEQCNCYYISSCSYHCGHKKLIEKAPTPLDWRKNNGKFYRDEIKHWFNVVSASESEEIEQES